MIASRGLLWLALLFAAAVTLAIVGRFDTGHVIFIYAPYRLDLSLNLFIVALTLTFIALYALIRMLCHVWKVPERVKAYRERSKRIKGHAALRDALKNLFAGQFVRAQKSAHHASAIGENREAASLIGANAAHRMREYTRRDEWLTQVADANWQDAKFMNTAEMLIEIDDATGALAALAEVHSKNARGIRAQQVALRAHQQLKHWPEVLQIVKTLEKRDAIQPALARRLRQLAAENLLRECRHDAQQLIQCWRSLSITERHAPLIADFAAELLIALQSYQQAQPIVEEALAHHWDARLLRRYAQCAVADPLPLIERAESWRAEHPDDPELLFLLGLLCFQQQLWGKAQSFLESALALAADDLTLKKEVHCALARLHEALDHREDANHHYRASALEGVFYKGGNR